MYVCQTIYTVCTPITNLPIESNMPITKGGPWPNVGLLRATDCPLAF